MNNVEEPPLIRGTNYIISLTILLSIIFPSVVYEAFDNSHVYNPENTWNTEEIKAPLLIIAKEFTPGAETIGQIYQGNGSCVPYARSKTGINLSGWAGTFLTQAEEKGYATSTIPSKNGMLITSNSNGHVAVVEDITEDSIIISEQNYLGPYIISTRELKFDDPTIRGYIY